MSVSMLSVWLCVERFQSFSTASMQQFVSFNQQRYVTLTSTFARRSSVPAEFHSTSENPENLKR